MVNVSRFPDVAYLTDIQVTPEYYLAQLAPVVIVTALGCCSSKPVIPRLMLAGVSLAEAFASQLMTAGMITGMLSAFGHTIDTPPANDR